MSILYEGGDSCFINYLSHSIDRKCVQSMLKLLKKKKETYEILNSFYPDFFPRVDFIRIRDAVETCQGTDRGSKFLGDLTERVS